MTIRLTAVAGIVVFVVLVGLWFHQTTPTDAQVHRIISVHNGGN